MNKQLYTPPTYQSNATAPFATPANMLWSFKKASLWPMAISVASDFNVVLKISTLKIAGLKSPYPEITHISNDLEPQKNQAL